MSMTVRISGLAELDRALGELPKATARNVLIRTLNKAAEPMVEVAKQLAPKGKTGTLRDSIAASSRLKNKVGNAEYSAAMRSGLGKDVARGALLAARKAGKGQGSFAQLFVGPAKGTGAIRYAHLVEFGSVNNAPKPYMRPAWEETKMKMLDTIKGELGNQIIAAARRLGRSKKQSAEVKYRASIGALLAHEAGA